MLLALAVLVPFHDKAFTIDDTLFLHAAEQVIRSPLQPASFVVVWDLDKPVRASSGIFVSGPVAAYLLAPCILLGGAEWMAHAVHWVLLCFGILATVSLARGLGYSSSEATLAGLMVASAPAVLGMASTSMPDIPAMVLGVCGIERIVAWRRERRLLHGVLSALFLALAMLTRVHMVLLLAVAAILLSDVKPTSSSGNFMRLFPLAGAVGLLLLVLGVMKDPHVPATEDARTLSSLLHLWPMRSNLLAFGINWTLAMPFAIPWLLLRRRGLDWRPAALLLTALALLRPAGAAWWTVAVSTAGILALIDYLWMSLRAGDSTQIALGFWLLLPLPALAYFHTPAKYHVAAAPAVALIVVRALRGASPKLRRFVVAGALTGGLVLGVLIVRADAVLAGLGRAAAAELIVPAVARGEHVWSAGHWGFQWYAEKSGARPLTLTPPYPSPGDIVVRSTVDSCAVLSNFSNRTLVNTRSYSPAGGRVMNRRDNAGFYSNLWGYLPWSWGDSEINSFEVWRMNQARQSRVDD